MGLTEVQDAWLEIYPSTEREGPDLGEEEPTTPFHHPTHPGP